MVRAAPQTAGNVRAPRPCYRLHVLTYLVLLLTIALLVALIAPGQVTMSVTGWGGHQNRFEHGWPWRYLTRSTYPDFTELLALGSAPLRHRQCWSRRGRDIEFDKTLLAADLALALGSLPIIAVAFESWRRRRPRVLQFSTRQLAVAVVLCGIALTWWTSWQRRHAAVESSARAVNKQSISLTFGYVGPTWLGRLTGGPEAFWEPEGLLIFGETGATGSLKKRVPTTRSAFRTSATLASSPRRCRLPLSKRLRGCPPSAQFAFPCVRRSAITSAMN